MLLLPQQSWNHLNTMKNFLGFIVIVGKKNVAKKSCRSKNLGKDTEESTLVKTKKVVFL